MIVAAIVLAATAASADPLTCSLTDYKAWSATTPTA
jgi:hypothetical protein